jgi:hypothetical protein
VRGMGCGGRGTGGIPFPRTIAENIQFLCNIAAKIGGGGGEGVGFDDKASCLAYLLGCSDFISTMIQTPSWLQIYPKTHKCKIF